MIGPFEVILLVAFCRIEAGVPVVQPTVPWLHFGAVYTSIYDHISIILFLFTCL